MIFFDPFLCTQFCLTSVHNAKLKAVVKLKDRRYRKKTASFLVEGFRELSRYLDGLKKAQLGLLPPINLFFSPNLFLGSNEVDLLRAFAEWGTELFQVPSDVFSSFLSYRDRPDGLLAVVPIPKKDFESWNPNHITRMAILHQIEKPGNLGAILRSADAAGIQAVFLSDPVTDIWNPNAVRSSLGALFSLPVFQGASMDINNWMKKNQVQLLATTPQGGKALREINWSQPTCFLLGSEQLGLNSFWIKNADHVVSLPMLGSVDSLNVSTAAAIFFFAPLI